MEMLKSHQMHNYLKSNECYKTNTVNYNNNFKTRGVNTVLSVRV